MKRLILTVAAVLTLAGGLAACTKKTEAPAASTDMSKMAMSGDAKMAKGTGIVTAVTTDSITVSHGPIVEADWPAMTMAFKAMPAVAKTVKAGDKVAFDLKLQGGGGEITAIQKQ